MFGPFGDWGFHKVKKLASAPAKPTGEEEGLTIRKGFVLLSVLLMKGNAAI